MSTRLDDDGHVGCFLLEIHVLRARTYSAFETMHALVRVLTIDLSFDCHVRPFPARTKLNYCTAWFFSFWKMTIVSLFHAQKDIVSIIGYVERLSTDARTKFTTTLARRFPCEKNQTFNTIGLSHLFIY